VVLASVASYSTGCTVGQCGNAVVTRTFYYSMDWTGRQNEADVLIDTAYRILRRP